MDPCTKVSGPARNLIKRPRPLTKGRTRVLLSGYPRGPRGPGMWDVRVRLGKFHEKGNGLGVGGKEHLG